MNIYIASPLFHKWEQRNVKYIEKWLKTIFRGATIYCPQDFQVPNAWELPNHVWAKKIFEEDHKQLTLSCVSPMVINPMMVRRGRWAMQRQKAKRFGLLPQTMTSDLIV